MLEKQMKMERLEDLRMEQLIQLFNDELEKLGVELEEQAALKNEISDQLADIEKQKAEIKTLKENLADYLPNK